MYYETQYRLIAPKTFRKRETAAMTIAFVTCIAICIM